MRTTVGGQALGGLRLGGNEDPNGKDTDCPRPLSGGQYSPNERAGEDQPLTKIGGSCSPGQLRCSIDWLQISVKGIRARTLLSAIYRHTDWVDARHRKLKVVRYDGRYLYQRGPLGFRLDQDRVGSEDSEGHRWPFAFALFPGKLCQHIGTGNLMRLVAQLTEKYGERVKVTRIDLAVDDYGQAFTPAWFAQQLIGHRDIVAHDQAPLADGVVTSINRQQAMSYTTRERTCYLGRTKSHRYLRVYDKELESGGEIKATRLELQLRDEAACQAVTGLLEARDLGSAMVAQVSAFVDFRVVSGDGDRRHSDRWKRCEWWEKLVGSERRKAIRKRTIEKVKDGKRLFQNIRQRVKAQCRTLVEALGGDLAYAMSLLIQDGTGELIPVRLEDRTKVRALRGALVHVRDVTPLSSMGLDHDQVLGS